MWLVALLWCYVVGCEHCEGVFPGGKGGRCVGLTTLPPSCAVVMKSGNLNFLEPSGPVQAYNGTDFFLLIVFFWPDDNRYPDRNM